MKRTLRFFQREIAFSVSTHQYQHRYYTDAALLWGKANSRQAQVSLQPPPFPTSSSSSAKKTPRNWSEFWEWRNWNFSSSSSSADRGYKQALVTHVLTGPLTLAQARYNVQHWTCLGARAESMLPVPYWKEFLYYRHGTNSHNHHYINDEAIVKHTTLSFVGPECDHVPSQQQLRWNDDSSLTLKWSFRGKYHDMPDDSSDTTDGSSRRHGFVLFNPGFAHPHLQKDWRPTLEKLWYQTGSSCYPPCFVLTAHSAADAERDWKLWNAFDSTLPNYKENPWASQITYQDPLDGSNITIRPNAYVCHHHVL